MKKKYLKTQVPETEKLPVGHVVWTIKPFDARLDAGMDDSNVISEIHNTSDYPLTTLHKPINTLIDFNINENY